MTNNLNGVKIIITMKKGGEKVKNLIKLRKEAKMTQTQLAEQVGVNANTISQYELAKRQPSLEILKKIAQVLNCSIDELVKEEA